MRTQHLVAALLAAAVSWPALGAGPLEAGAYVECGAVSALADDKARPAGLGVSVPSYTAAQDKSADDRAREMRALHAWLSAEAAGTGKAGGVRVTATRQELHSIGDADCPECALLRNEERRYLVGVGKPIGLEVDFGRLSGKALGGAFANGALARTADGGFVWTTSIHSAGAHALRVVFANLDLPDDAELFVFNRVGEAFGPYGGRGIGDSGTVVANTVTGDTVQVQLRYYGAPDAAALARTRFTIAEVGHIGSRFVFARRVNAELASQAKAFCSYNASCVLNGECTTSSTWAPIDSVRRGVAHMLFRSGNNFYICSGSLLNNTSGNGRPLFLTANHCISKSGEAGSLETFWDFRASSCSNSGACDLSYAQMRTQFPTTLGATLLAHGTSGDYSLMELSAVPGGTRTYLGFNAGAVSGSSGLDLFRLSHPSGAPQSFSRQDVNTSAGTCQTLSRGPFIYSTDSAGATEGGSSGSAVLNAAGQVVGQLYGACGTNLNDVCDSASNRTVDGALAHYYPNVDDFLAPGGGGGGTVAHVTSIVLSREVSGGNRTRAVATVTVRNASNQPVGGATVSGQFTGFYASTASGTTNGSGVAVLQSVRLRGSGSIAFCVTGITGSNVTYDSAANTETCDNL